MDSIARNASNLPRLNENPSQNYPLPIHNKRNQITTWICKKKGKSFYLDADECEKTFSNLPKTRNQPKGD